MGVVVAFGASANGTPALASDGLDPVPPPELTAPEDFPTLPELDVDETAVVPVLEEPPIVIDTEVEGGDVDVSVRVLSPAEDEAKAPAETAADAISDAIEPDITADPVVPDTPRPTTAPIDEDTLDTNVAIRVLSPGRNGWVEQQSGPADDEAAGPSQEPSPDLAPTDGAEPANPTDERAQTAEAAPQYQADNTQYQSDGITNADPWVWEWYLALDCSGNVTSTSSDSGSPGSRDWDWKWTWDWACGLDGASEESGDALQEGFASVASVSSPVREPSAGSGGKPEEPDASGTPWLWTWSFDFCGRETTFSIQAGEQTNLDWTWSWTWAWACTSAEVVSPAPGEGQGGEGTGGAADTSAPSGALELPPPLAIVIDQPLLPELLFAASPIAVPFVVEAPISIAPVMAPISIAPVMAPISIAPVIPLGRTLPTGTGPELAPASGPGRAPAPAPATVVVAVVLDHATASPDSPHHERAQPTKGHGRDAAPRPARRLPQLPLGPTRRAAGSSTSSGGAAPGGAGATGVAALTGFYVLAAPGLGRRIRVVRELSPHARAEAPRDRPG